MAPPQTEWPSRPSRDNQNATKVNKPKKNMEPEVDIPPGKTGRLTDHANEIIEGLWLGSMEAAMVPLEELQRCGITHVLVPAMIAGFQPERYPQDLRYKTFYIADISAWPILPLLPEATGFIEEARQQGGGVLVHCASGISRSASFVIAYLMTSSSCMSFNAAKNLVRQKRPCISSKFEEQLRMWEGMGGKLEGSSAAHQQARLKGYLTPHRKNRSQLAATAEQS
ncbi:Polynucleotide 5'-hydroxyl-kinase nol9 [Balamuthia mandrillaris]